MFTAMFGALCCWGPLNAPVLRLATSRLDSGAARLGGGSTDVHAHRGAVSLRSSERVCAERVLEASWSQTSPIISLFSGLDLHCHITTCQFGSQEGLSVDSEDQ